MNMFLQIFRGGRPTAYLQFLQYATNKHIYNTRKGVYICVIFQVTVLMTSHLYSGITNLQLLTHNNVLGKVWEIL